MNNNITIFIVDDDASVRDSLAVLLTTSGFNVESYDSGQAFLDAYEPDRKGCLILDIRMPGMSGLELQKILVKEKAPVPIIIMTAYGDIKTAVKAMKQGAVDFVEKPFKDDVIIESINNALFHNKQAIVDQASIKDIHELVAQLTKREHEVFTLLIQGNPNKVIAAELCISPRTVEIHRARVMEKMQAKNLPHLVKKAVMAELS